MGLAVIRGGGDLVESERAVQDRLLVERIAGGDAEALAELYDRYARVLFGVVYRMLSSDLLRAASAEHRVLLTENVKHFRPIAERLQGEGTAYAGLLFTSARTFPRARSPLRPLFAALDRYLAQHPEDDALADSWDWLSP